MSTITVKTYIPLLSSFGYCKEIHNIDNININKLINLQDDNQLQDYFFNLLDDNMVYGFDKLYSLISLRILCVGDELKLIDTETNANITINLPLTLDRLIENVIVPLSAFEKDNFKLSFKLPTLLYYNNFIHLLKDIVKDLSVDGVDINYSELSNGDKLKVLSRIKPELITEIKKHISLNAQKYKVAELDNSLSKEYYSFYNNSCFNYLKFIFKNNISSIYNKLYHCCNKLNMSLTDFNSITPSETDLLLAIFKDNNSIK